jgi:hypothetical protein
MQRIDLHALVAKKNSVNSAKLFLIISATIASNLRTMKNPRNVDIAI